MNSSHPQEEWALDSAVGLVHKEVSGEQDSLQRYAREEEMKKRRQKAGRRRRWDLEQGITITVDKKRRGSKKGQGAEGGVVHRRRCSYCRVPFWDAHARGIPHAARLCRSFLLSCLLFEASTDADNVRVINYFGGLVLGTRHSTSCSSASSTSSWKAPALAWVMRIRKGRRARAAQDRRFDRVATPADFVTHGATRGT
ncbi:hypothetical protein HGRIS_011949 [Hohenbuehelia grisea]|uniref:Uncharacterized protein n=1 Tax=Hohenbuehelia grisea TaxID=104357 RepID=A0ABR3JYQ3_9AGAR